MRLNESRVFHHVGELVRSTLSDWILPHSSSSSRILRKARATGAVVEFGLDEGDGNREDDPCWLEDRGGPGENWSRYG